MLIKIRNVVWQTKIKSAWQAAGPTSSFFAPKPHVVTLTAVSSNAVMDEGKQEVRIILSAGYCFSFFLISSRCKTVLDITDKVHLSDSCSSLCHAHYILACFNFNQPSLAFLLLFSNYYDFINDFNFSFFKTFCFDP